jgi:hypothetical protein
MAVQKKNNVHYVSEGLTLRQHEELTTNIKILMKTKRSALFGRHQHYMLMALLSG